MLVTKIQAVTKQKYRIELDGQPAFVIYKGELSRYGIKEGQEIPGPVYQELVGQVLTKRAKLRAMHLLESMDRTRAELERKLQAGEYPGKLWKRHLRMWNLLDIWMTEDMPGIMWNVKKRAEEKQG